MQGIEIRKVGMGDIKELQTIAKQTFIETFAAVNSEENMKVYLEQGFSNEKLTAELQNDDSEFYFASEGEKIIGYLKINTGPSQTELDKDSNSIEIERIYVLNQFHGKGVGQLLLEKAIEIAKAQDVKFVWLGVWEENTRAISFYRKNGFTEFDKHIFKLGSEEQTDILMKKLVSEIKS
jgi:diamine N-acetyltransferase